MFLKFSSILQRLILDPLKKWWAGIDPLFSKQFSIPLKTKGGVTQKNYSSIKLFPFPPKDFGNDVEIRSSTEI